MKLFLYTYDVKANKSVLEDITDHDLHKVPYILSNGADSFVQILIKSEAASKAQHDCDHMLRYCALTGETPNYGQPDETEINMFNNNEPLLELIADDPFEIDESKLPTVDRDGDLHFDEEQFKVQPVNHDNDVDCDGMCCSDCTVSNCPVRDNKVIVKHM